MDQLNAVAVNDTQDTGFHQKDIRPDLMGDKLAKQPRALWQEVKKRQEIALQPAIELPVAYPFQGEQDAQRHNLAGIELSLGMFRQLTHRLINSAEQFADKTFGGHEVSPFANCLVTLNFEDWGHFSFGRNVFVSRFCEAVS